MSNPNVWSVADHIADQMTSEYAAKRACEQEVELDSELSVMDKICNSRLGRAMMTGMAIGAPVGGAAFFEAYTAAPVVAENMPASSAPNLSPGTLKQKCIKKGLAKPIEKKPPAMNHAGIRPFTPHHYYVQNVSGELDYPDISSFCVPEVSLVRISRGQLEMRSQKNPNAWIKLGPADSPVNIGNGKGVGEINYSPTHAWPDRLFNGCVDGKFMEVKIVGTETMKDPRTHKVEASSNFTIKVPVNGNCAAAKESAKIAKTTRQNWGGA